MATQEVNKPVYRRPAKPEHFVAREKYEELVARLTEEPIAPRILGLRGPGGYGKSTLAAALCHNLDVEQVFPHGIIWSPFCFCLEWDRFQVVGLGA